MFKNNKSHNKFFILNLIFGLLITPKVTAQIQNADVLNAPIDISKDFENYLNTFYFAEELAGFISKPEKEGDGIKAISLSKKGADFQVAPNTLTKTTFKIEWAK